LHKRAAKIDHQQTLDAFATFTEIGILHQLSRTLLEGVLPDGLQVIHFSVLNNLTARGGGRLPSDLAKAFQVPRSHMTDVLAKLSRLELIRLSPNPEDGRSKLIHISDKGTELRQEALRRLDGPISELAQVYDLDKMLELKPKLAELRNVMDGMRDQHPPKPVP